MSVPLLFAAFEVVELSVATAGYDIGSGRTLPGVAVVAGLISVTIGGPTLSRAGFTARISAGNRRTGAIIALVIALAGVIIGGLHAANSAGGFGTGNGLAGAVFALLFGLTGMVLSGLALSRARRTT